MNTKQAFIVHHEDGTIRIITEGVLTKDITKIYAETHPNNPIKSKLFNQMASEAMVVLNGSSLTEKDYDSNVYQCAFTLYTHENMPLIEFGKYMQYAQYWISRQNDRDKRSSQTTSEAPQPSNVNVNESKEGE